MTKSLEFPVDRLAGIVGVFAVCFFGLSMTAFSVINQGFDPLNDYISVLGSKDEPYSLWWNLTGFGLVGICLALFGWMYGRVIEDHLTGTLLAVFGIAFATAAIPVDFENTASGVSKAHIAAVCIGVAAWMLGLARFASSVSPDRFSKGLANTVSLLLVLSAIGHAGGFWSMSILHRLVLGIVFLWTFASSIRLLKLRSDTTRT